MGEQESKESKESMNVNIKNETVLGIDVGEKRVGLAISERGVTIALPLKTVQRAESFQEIALMVKQRGVSIMVFGWPLELGGRGTRAVKRVETFEQGLRSHLETCGYTDLIYERMDERMSTVMAHAQLSEAKVFGRRRKAVVDQVAAVNLLEAYIGKCNVTRGV